MAETAQGPDDDGKSTENGGSVVDHIETVRVRRSPKYSVFLAVGAGLGILAALALTFIYSGTNDVSPNTGMVYSQGQVFGFLALICITAGIVVGGVTALILDRVLAAKTREVIVDRESVRLDD